MAPGINYKLTLESDVRGAADVESKIADLERKLEPLRRKKHLESLGREFDDLSKRMNQPTGAGFFSSISQRLTPAKDALRDLVGAVPGLSALNGALLSITGVIGAALFAAKKGVELVAASIREWAAAEERLAELDQALANRGHLTARVRAEVRGLVDDLQESTNIDSEAWTDVLAQLLKFGAAPADLGRYAEGVANLAALLGTDLASASSLFVKAMQGNFDMLSRYGLKVDETLSQSQKMDALLRQAAAGGADIFGAKLDTLSGRWKTFKNEAADALKTIGSYLAPLLKPLVWLITALPGGFNRIAGPLSGPVDPNRNKIPLGTPLADDASQIQTLGSKASAAASQIRTMADELRALHAAAASLADAKLLELLQNITVQELRGQLTPAEADRQRSVARDQTELEALDRQEVEAKNNIGMAGAQKDLSAGAIEDARRAMFAPVGRHEELRGQIDALAIKRLGAPVGPDANTAVGLESVRRIVVGKLEEMKALNAVEPSKAADLEKLRGLLFEAAKALAEREKAEQAYQQALAANAEKIKEAEATIAAANQSLETIGARKTAAQASITAADVKKDKTQTEEEERKKKSETAAREELDTEMAILRARAAGKEEEVRRLEIQRAAKRIAADTGYGEKEAVALATEDYDLRRGRPDSFAATPPAELPMEQDRLGRIGLFVGGQGGALDYAQRTAEATAKVAAWIQAGAPMTPRNTSQGGGARYA